MPAEPYNFFFDASTTVVTRGKLEMYNKAEKPLPEGWALDKNGHPSTNAPDVLANIVAKKVGFAGQTCVNYNRIYVPETVYKELCDKVAAELSKVLREETE